MVVLLKEEERLRIGLPRKLINMNWSCWIGLISDALLCKQAEEQGAAFRYGNAAGASLISGAAYALRRRPSSSYEKVKHFISWTQQRCLLLVHTKESTPADPNVWLTELTILLCVFSI